MILAIGILLLFGGALAIGVGVLSDLAGGVKNLLIVTGMAGWLGGAVAAGIALHASARRAPSPGRGPEVCATGDRVTIRTAAGVRLLDVAEGHLGALGAVWTGGCDPPLPRAETATRSAGVVCVGTSCGLESTPERPVIYGAARVGGLGADILATHLDRPDGTRRLSRLRPDGGLVWTNAAIMDRRPGLFLLDDALLVVGERRTHLLDPASGVARWSVEAGAAPAPIRSGGRLLLVTGAVAVGVDLATGAVAYRTSL